MILLKGVNKEKAAGIPTTSLTTHYDKEGCTDICIQDGALTDFVFKKDYVLITFDIDFAVEHKCEWTVGLRADDFWSVELY